MTLALSIAALLLGPFIYAFGRRQPLLRRIFDASIVLSIGVIVIVHIVPEAIEHGGRLAAIVILLGLLFPVLLERLFRKATDVAHLAIVAIAAFGLVLHAVIDGIALLPQTGTGLAYAIVLHRIPVGMALWWSVRPNFGVLITGSLFALICIATAAGYFLGDTIVEFAETRALAMLQAFISGSLIHVVLFGVTHDHTSDT